MMKKVIKVILCVVLFTISIGGLTACNSSNLNEEIRTITVENFNYDEYLATLDECSISKSQESVVIDAVKTFDKSILEGVNNVAYGEVNDFELKAECRPFLDKYGRFPYLDELPNSNSEPYLKESIEMTDTSAKIDKILEATGAESIEEANVILND